MGDWWGMKHQRRASQSTDQRLLWVACTYWLPAHTPSPKPVALPAPTHPAVLGCCEVGHGRLVQHKGAGGGEGGGGLQ